MVSPLKSMMRTELELIHLGAEVCPEGKDAEKQGNSDTVSECARKRHMCVKVPWENPRSGLHVT